MQYVQIEFSLIPFLMKGYERKKKTEKERINESVDWFFTSIFRFISVTFYYISSSVSLQILMSISVKKANVHLICTSPIVRPYSFLSCVPALVLSSPPLLLRGKKRGGFQVFYSNMNIFCNIFCRQKKLPCLLGDFDKTIRLMCSFLRLSSVSDVY
jgi:hypothetical protein